jgi:kynurenine formamidase
MRSSLTRRLATFGLALAGAMAPLSSAAQDTVEGQFWPHPIWGAEDRAGGSNWITPEKVLEAFQLVETGKIYELGQVYERGMPLFGERSYSIFLPAAGAAEGVNQIVAHEEYVCAEIGQVGTQFDGPGHIGKRMKLADGRTADVYYNGHTDDEIATPYGLLKIGVENVKPIFTRGILIDIAGYKSVDHLPHSYEVTVADVQGALERQGLTQDAIRDGDAIFFRYGWSKLWNEPERYNHNPPGIGLGVARWAVERNASMIGSDSWTTEVVPNPDPELAFPVHQELITKNGVFNLENLVFDDLIADEVQEFLFVVTPLRLKGATGSPARPIAIR